MKKVILFGGTGHLGKQIAAALQKEGYQTTAVVRNEDKARVVRHLVQKTVVANVTDPASLAGICSGFDVVISALGKPVSPLERSRATFYDVDFMANSHILEEARKSQVKKFVYVSAFGAEKYPQLAYFRVHHQFAEKLKASGIDYAIVKPVALFSAFLDLVPMAKQGRLVTLGRGDKRTNPIDEADLARICVKAIAQPNAVIEAGGKEVLTRHQINVLIQLTVAPTKRVRRMPMGLVRASLPPLKLFSRNLYDKLAFVTAVMQHDTIAPALGQTTLDEYIRRVKTAKKCTGRMA